MEWNRELLSRYLLHTLSLVPEPRQTAEKWLSDAADLPNYGLADDSGISPIVGSEKEQIKSLIVSLMLSSSPRIQSQLSEAIGFIGMHDFPKSWPALLPDLIDYLQQASLAGDYVSVSCILGTASLIFEKFRDQYGTVDLCLELKYCLDSFAAPLTKVFLHTSSLIDSAASSDGSAAFVKHLFESQRLCCTIFYSLNFQDLPEFFEDHMNEWMAGFKKYLSSDYPAVESKEEGLTLVDDLRAAVCENINLYIEKYEEEFKVFLNDFSSAIWTLLCVVLESPNRGNLATAAIKFLTTVSTSVHHALFASDNVIKKIFHSIVIPNVSLRAEDEEMFEMDYTEFILRDREGSDEDTRRKTACELLKGLATNYKTQVTEEIRKFLDSILAIPAAHWKHKDCAIYLVVSLSTKKAGGASVSTDLIEVQRFFENIILPELQSWDVNSLPMLKAGCLKFLDAFRNHLPKPLAMQLFPEVVRFLKAESNVVHSYAASCIEKLLLVKEEGGKGNRYGAGDVSPFLLQLMTNLFDALKFPESEENHYLMKCIMRVLGVADIRAEVAGPCIGGLTSILNDVCKEPKPPMFNHYLFESVAVLVRRACERDISLVPEFERSLFPSLQMILANDITELMPYAFQLLAQLVELNRPPLTPNYMQIFSPLLSLELWNRSGGNVPALVRLLQAFLQKALYEVTQENRLSQVLGIFEKLVEKPSTDEQGFYILNTIVENVEYNVIAPYMKQRVWNALFTRLERKKTFKFQKSLVIFMSLFLVKHGQACLVETMNAVHPNSFPFILEHIWIPNMKLIKGTTEVKLAAVAATRLISETPALLDPSAAKLWAKMLDSIVTLVSQPEQERVIDNQPEMRETSEKIGYKAEFVKLHNGWKKRRGSCKRNKGSKPVCGGISL